MTPIVLMDMQPGLTTRSYAGSLAYRLPEDRASFWTGRYPTAGTVEAFMCGSCGRIALYGAAPEA